MKGPPFDEDVIVETAPIHEEADCDSVLIGCFSDAPDSFMVGAHAASVTERLSLLLASAQVSSPPLSRRASSQH